MIFDLVPHAVALQASDTPDAVAVSDSIQTLTYRDLDQRANQLAHALRNLGAGPETVVGVFLDRGPDLVTALLATWRTGGVFLPLDPDMELAVPASHLTYRPGPFHRSLTGLPVHFPPSPRLPQN